jgi:hypothetical protein
MGDSFALAPPLIINASQIRDMLILKKNRWMKYLKYWLIEA